jgi:hypothetical protein
MFYPRIALVPAALAAAGLAVSLAIRADTTEGQPVTVGVSLCIWYRVNSADAGYLPQLAANRSQDAASVFGTSNQTVNFLSLPKDLCVVPMYQSQAGIGNDTTALLICQQALEICPQAHTIVVSPLDELPDDMIVS